MKNDLNYLLNQKTDTFVFLQEQIHEIVKLLRERLQLNVPIANMSENLSTWIKKTEPLPKESGSFFDVVQEKLKPLLPYMIDVNHPFCAAHLHCPPLISAISTELLIASLNLSMDSWDQSGAATLIEQQVIAWVGQLLDYPLDCDGVFTSGGTQSNWMGILLAREAFAKRHNLKPFTQTGLTGMSHPFRIGCTEHTHFSVMQAARWLGLGTDHVLVMHESTMEKTIEQCERHERPFVLVATAGCTDFGNIDSLLSIRKLCDKYQIWMHVDAAVGGALLLTNQKHRLMGIEMADSVTIDFHKLFFQPISASAFMVRNKKSFECMSFHSDYLNRESDEGEGTINLVNKSLQTTRRFDALKIWLTWQHIGLKALQQLIEKLLMLTEEAAKHIEKMDSLELMKPPSINTVVFRYRHPHHQNTINRMIRKILLDKGLAVIGETSYKGEVCLKLTLMNPEIHHDDLQKLIQLIIETGRHALP